MDGAQVSKVVILAMATYTSCTFMYFQRCCFVGRHARPGMHAWMLCLFLFLCLHEEESGRYVPLVWRRAKTPWLEACTEPAMRKQEEE